MNKFTCNTSVWIATILLILGVSIAASIETVETVFEISRYSIDGGGAMRSSAGDFELSGTIGQPDAGTMNGGTFELTGGFWFPLDAGDGNEDGVIDLIDYRAFQNCLNGPSGGSPDAACAVFDVNRNGTVDLYDFYMTQTTFTGS